MVLLMSMSRLSSPMVSKDFTEVSSSLPLVSSSTVACTSASMRHSSQSPWRGCWSYSFFHPWMGSDCHCRTHVLPHCHCQKEDDDDLWWWSQVQWIFGLLQTGPQERGIHVLDEG